MKKKIDVYEHMGEILKGVKSGVLITGKADDKVNSMTISWGMLGIEWGKPIFVTFIRENPFFLYALGVFYPVKIYSCDPSVLIFCIIPHITSVFCDHTGSRYRLRLTWTAIQIKLYSLSAVKLQL